MKVAKPLPKVVLGRMTPSGNKKLATLEKNFTKTGDEMKEAQAAASKAMWGSGAPPVQRLINKGFKAEFLAFKAADALRDYKDAMRAKYA